MTAKRRTIEGRKVERKAKGRSLVLTYQSPPFPRSTSQDVILFVLLLILAVLHLDIAGTVVIFLEILEALDGWEGGSRWPMKCPAVRCRAR